MNTQAENKIENSVSVGPRVQAWLVDAIAILGLIVMFVAGRPFWEHWLASTDRLTCTICAVVGLCIALARSTWSGDLSTVRFRLSMGLASIACLAAILTLALRWPEFSSVTIGCVFAAWHSLRVRHERLSQAVFLGLLCMFPFALNSIQGDAGLGWVGSAAMQTTAGLANMLKQPFAIEGDTILFSQGVADQFGAVEHWDGVVTLIGIVFFCLFAFRRKLLVAIASLAATPFIWIAVRSTTWMILSTLSGYDAAWLNWSPSVAVMSFLASALLVIALDVLFASIFEPIPFEMFNAESPLISYAWNWICGFPGVVLRIPSANKISARWRAKLRLAKVEPSWTTDYHWLRRELFLIVFSPIALIGGIIDAVRGWLYSRKWRRLWLSLFSFVLPVMVYIAFGLSFLRRSDQQVPLLAEESQRLCSTAALEDANFRLQEPAFSQLMGSPQQEPKRSFEPLPDLTRRYVELLSKRILAVQPKNQMAKYRLGLAYAMGGQSQRASNEMKELASGVSGYFPQAVEWRAKDLVLRKAVGEDIVYTEIVENVEKLLSWPQVDYRLMRDYAKLMVLSGEYTKAIAASKQAVAANPELILDLALLYARVKHPETKETAAQAEAYYLGKINFPTEKESDRLAVAKARLLADRTDQAEEILAEGLRRGISGDQVRRELSNIQILKYKKSIQTDENGKSTADVSLLEKAAVTDPTNPNIATEIAGMIPQGLNASDALKSVLTQQWAKGVINVDTHLLLGDAFFAKGEIERAQSQWKAALDKSPNNVAAMNNYAYCLAVNKQPDLEKSLELLGHAHQLAPENADVLDTWGEVLMLARRPREAVNKFELSISFNKKSIPTRKKLAEAYLAAGLEDDAKAVQSVISDLEAAETTENP
ncbi:MAG: hypothetical protein ABL921_10450 [Pirellula sp.]